MTRKKIIEDYHKLAREKGFKYILDYIPANSHTKPTKDCWDCGNHTWSAAYSDIKQNKGCPYCAGNIKKTIEDYYKLAVEKGLEFIGQESDIINTNTKIWGWKCKENHTWLGRYSDIKQNVGCSQCYGNNPKTIEDFTQVNLI